VVERRDEMEGFRGRDLLLCGAPPFDTVSELDDTDDDADTDDDRFTPFPSPPPPLRLLSLRLPLPSLEPFNPLAVAGFKEALL
jgi:hypothetical protein